MLSLIQSNQMEVLSEQLAKMLAIPLSNAHLLTTEQVLKRLNYKTELDELISEGIIDLKDDFIVIKFLDNQLVEVEKTSKQNALNGAKGGRPKKQTESENKPTALFSLSETKGIREDKIIEYEIRENNLKENKENKEKYNFSDELFNDPQWNESIRRLNKINSDSSAYVPVTNPLSVLYENKISFGDALYEITSPEP